MKDNGDGCAFMMLGFIVSAILGLAFLLVIFGDKPIPRDEAVKAGHAEYYLDSHNERQWRWKNDGLSLIHI